MNSLIGISISRDHCFSKTPVSQARLLRGIGLEGDVHSGVTVQHRSRVQADPTQPNLRQVHLLHFELIQQIRVQGFDVYPGSMGENLTTVGIDLLGLPPGTLLNIGAVAQLCITGLRNPCKQLDDYRPGLMAAVLERDADGSLVRKAGVMAVVVKGGLIRLAGEIVISRPDAQAGAQQKLMPV
ncbi:MOSC domain-containing protein [Pseudomonadales bacterium]|nr:MOSC domain-containing protein [Pseudomonadales bacterium]